MGLRSLAARSLLVSLTLPVLAPVTQAQGSGSPLERLQERRSSLSEELVPALLQLAQECRKARLYGEAEGLYEVVLTLDGDDAVARRALRYHPVSKRWVQARGYKRRRNGSDSRLEEFRGRIDALLEPFRDALLVEIDRLQEERGLGPAWSELERLRESLPRDELLLGRLGEVRVDGRWLLVESERSLRRREAFPNLAKDCLRLAPEALAAQVRDEERALGLSWSTARRTADVRVLGTTAQEEVTTAARLSHAVGDFFRFALEAEGGHREDFTIYLVERGEKERLLAAWPGLSQRDLAGLSQADGGWLGAGNRLGEWSANPARRLDGAARQTLGTLLMDSFGIDGRHGWAWEGAGLYLVHELLGTRLTWFFSPEGYAPQATSGLWSQLQASGVDWLAHAASLIDSGRAPNLVHLLGRGVNGLREEDVLYSYALAAYLFQGHRRRVPQIFRRIGDGEHPTRVFEEELGLPLPVIEVRLRRWLRETR